MKNLPIGIPEASARNYHYTVCNISEERKYHLLRGGSLKTRILSVMFPTLPVILIVISNCIVLFLEFLYGTY